MQIVADAPDTSATIAHMQSINVNKVPKNAQLIDVREPEEYAEVHAVGATNLPLSELTTLTDRIDPDQDIYVICRSGGRSSRACEYLEQVHGWEPINVEGGTMEWIANGLPTE